MIRREVLLSHSKAVATLRVHVQLGRFVSAGPLFVQGNAVRRESELIVGGRSKKHWRNVGWNGSLFKPPGGRIDRSYEGGPAFWLVTEGDSGSDRSPGGESDNADAVGGNSPIGCVLPKVGDPR